MMREALGLFILEVVLNVLGGFLHCDAAGLDVLAEAANRVARSQRQNREGCKDHLNFHFVLPLEQSLQAV